MSIVRAFIDGYIEKEAGPFDRTSTTDRIHAQAKQTRDAKRAAKPQRRVKPVPKLGAGDPHANAVSKKYSTDAYNKWRAGKQAGIDKRITAKWNKSTGANDPKNDGKAFQIAENKRWDDKAKAAWDRKKTAFRQSLVDKSKARNAAVWGNSSQNVKPFSNQHVGNKTRQRYNTVGI